MRAGDPISREWLRNVPLNRDRNLRMQYLAGLGLNLDDAAAIYAGMLPTGAFPRISSSAQKGGWTRYGGPFGPNRERISTASAHQVLTGWRDVRAYLARISSKSGTRMGLTK